MHAQTVLGPVESLGPYPETTLETDDGPIRDSGATAELVLLGFGQDFPYLAPQGPGDLEVADLSLLCMLGSRRILQE